MTTFTDGPAAETVLELRRAPKFLRVVRDADGTVDALDQLNDTPKPSPDPAWLLARGFDDVFKHPFDAAVLAERIRPVAAETAGAA